MNDAVKKRIEQIRQKANEIACKVDGMFEDIDAIETDDDLAIIEMAFDQIESWAKEGYEIVRNTYDEFGENWKYEVWYEGNCLAEDDGYESEELALEAGKEAAEWKIQDWKNEGSYDNELIKDFDIRVKLC